MKYRVKIKEGPKYQVKVNMPEAKTGMQVEGSLYNQPSSFGGADADNMMPETKVRKTITKVPREEANLEAEGGETVLTYDAAGYPLFYEIKGPRHSNNGVPLNLPDDSFIFSDTKAMKINDPEILDLFGLSPRKFGYTPADISKKYLDLNKHRDILQNSDSDKITKASAERMIQNMLVKLGGLAITQESKKGFPQGVPSVAKQYMEAYGISEQDIVPQKPEEGQELQSQPSPMEAGVEQMPPTQGEQEDMMMSPEMMEQAPMAMYGAIMGGYNMPYEYAYGGNLSQAKDGQPTNRTKTQAELEAELRGGKANVQKIKTLPDGTTEVTRADGTKVYAKGNVYGQEDYSNIKVKPSQNLATNAAKYEKDICSRIRNSKKPIEFAIANGWITASRKGEFENCVDAAAVKKDDSEFYELEPTDTIPPEEQCECKDPVTGDLIYSEPDANGECPPCSGYVPNETSTIEEEQFQQPGTYFPEDIANIQAARRMKLPRKDPMYAGPRGTQLEQYGIDPRGASNTLNANTAAAIRAIGQTVGTTPGGKMAAMFQAQKANAQGIKEAFDQANKFNTDTRNNEIAMNTQMRKNFLDKEPAYKLDYDAKLAQQAQNQARNINAKSALEMAQRTGAADRAFNIAVINEANENKAFDPVTKKFITKKGRALKKDPTAGGQQLASRTKELMNQNIGDATAYKIAMQELQSKFGGATMFQDGGFIYTVYPIESL